MSAHLQNSDNVEITEVHRALGKLLQDASQELRDMLCKGFAAGRNYALRELAEGRRPNPISYMTSQYSEAERIGFPVVPGTENPMLGFLAGVMSAMQPAPEGGAES